MDMSKSLASAPTRSSNSFVLSWGAVNIPCSLYVGLEEIRVARKEFVKDTDHAAGRVIIDKETGTVIDRADIVKRAEASNGVWVELDDDEIAAITSDRGLANIVAFIPVKSLGEYETEGLIQVRPKRTKGKFLPGAERGLACLLAALAYEKVVALVNVALRGPARYGILDAAGDFRWVVTADAIRQPLELPEWDANTAQEVALFRQVIKVVGKSTPVLTDDTATAIQAYVDSKAAGAPVVTAEDVPVPDTSVMEQLLASIAAHKGVKAS
jgi:non-homologous end joining protein Ku